MKPSQETHNPSSFLLSRVYGSNSPDIFIQIISKQTYMI